MFNKIFSLTATFMLSLGIMAQTFEHGDATYKSVSTYDSWAASPFRTGILSGNAKIIDNPFKTDNNRTDKCLAYQRSRFASNMYGTRVDLSQPFELTASYKYIHALMHRPKSGRVMCIGLGKQRNASQSEEVEQFHSVSTQELGTNEWYDAVFAVRGAGNIDIHSLVFVTDLESTHDMTEDHIAYVDEIEVNTNAAPRVISDYYPISFPEKQISGKADHYIRDITLECSQSGAQTVNVGRLGTNLVYRDMLSTVINAVPGETIKPVVSYTGDWMHTFIYLDRDDNGFFEIADNICQDNPRPDCDLLTYSYIETVENTRGYNPSGRALTGDKRNTLDAPAFTVPANLKPGMYRMRVKVDYGDPTPNGRMTETNDIVSNGGQIVDFMLNVHAPYGTLTQDGLNGEIMSADRTSLSGARLPFGQPVKVYQDPAPGFVAGKVTVRYGHNLQGDSLLHGNPQWFELTLPATATAQDGILVIPSEYAIADMHLMSDFIEKSKACNPTKQSQKPTTHQIKAATLRFDTQHTAILDPIGSGLKQTLDGLSTVTFQIVPMPGYELVGTVDITTDNGVIRYTSATMPANNIITVAVAGDMLVRAHYAESAAAQWHCIFQDEFEAEDGAAWDTNKWGTREMSNSTWARFNSQNPMDSVAFHHNGTMRLLARPMGNGKMKTGNLTTQGLCDFMHGKVEVRALIDKHAGNFPAIWMMPSANSSYGGWPNSGEIDIMEQINTEDLAYHTIHSYYGNILSNTHQKTSNTYLDMSRWHTYGIEWDKDQIRWYVDGIQRHAYDRIPEKDNEEHRQWPFNNLFYIIINQSVGNGSWAAEPDFNHTYCMDVDYVRVYQLKQ